jgi:hypothetical protein
LEAGRRDLFQGSIPALGRIDGKAMKTSSQKSMENNPAKFRTRYLRKKSLRSLPL